MCYETFFNPVFLNYVQEFSEYFIKQFTNGTPLEQFRISSMITGNATILNGYAEPDLINCEVESEEENY